jgi:ribonuclease HI
MPSDRFISYNNPRELLIYTDGACLNNGQLSPAAGCGFVYRPFAYPDGVSIRNGGVCFRLESRGPGDVSHPQTTYRAELRAVIAALQCSNWDREGWESVVIACDSEYVALGITQWIHHGERNGCVTSPGHAVLNRDLWVVLKEELDRCLAGGVQVTFWRIPSEWNFEADQLAKYGAGLEVVEEFVRHRI